MAAKTSKRIVLTGVSRGLGRALAEGFIAAGHTVYGCARSAQAIAELQRQFAAPHAWHVVDVARDDQVREWAAAVLADQSVPDILVNCAATINRNAPLWQVSADEFDAVLATNVSGVANVIRHFVPAMVERGRGVIVSFSSYWGRSGAADVAPYCTSKWAVEGLTQALAEELPQGMAAVALNPGIINTDMLQSCFGEAAQSYLLPNAWAQAAVPYILQFGAQHNGKSLTVPGQ